MILGGTGEARALADALTALGQPFLSSLAGIVTDPILPVGDVRVGGFGGPTGLAQYLREHGVAAVVDATHPFAARMTAHAASACHAADVPLLRLQRPSWSTHPGAESWTWVDSHTEAGETAARLGHRIFLTTGRKTLSDFLAVPAMTTCEVLARLVEPPDLELPPTWRILRSRGPFSCADEIALLRKEQIDVLVTKDSGGPSTTAKLDAAAALRLPVIVVRRPPLPAGITQVAEVTDATAWVAQTTTH
nr:cobalt-precorrin-6A reductase [Austwickia sp. TVS 96-490-7B]